MRDVDSKTIDGITDLVVWAPIKDGFIDAFEMMTYETRLRVVAEALHNVRATAREHTLIEPFADTAKRILSLLDFRIGVVERDLFQADDAKAPLRPRRYMYLVATFGGPWEPYMRLIHNPLGAFLDLILCNCEGYIPAVDTDFNTYAQWVRDHQLDSAIFYATTGLTVKDKLYLKQMESLQRNLTPAESDLKIAKMTSDDPDDVAQAVRRANPLKHNQLALEALNVLYRLADFYPPDRLDYQGAGQAGDHPTGEGRYLIRAAQDLLKGWQPELLPKNIKTAFADQLSWFTQNAPPSTMQRRREPVLDRKEVQKGLLSSYDTPEAPTTHGSLLFLQVVLKERAAEFLKMLPVSYEEPDPLDIPQILKNVFFNVGVTFRGLDKLGVPKSERSVFPKAFRQGMEARAPVIGDVRENHPREWEGIPRNWPRPGNKARTPPPINGSEVDIILQIRTSDVCGYGIYQKGGDGIGPSESRSTADEYIAFEEVPDDLDVMFDNKGSEGPSFADLDNAEFEHLDPIGRLIAFIGKNGDAFGVRLLGTQSLFRREAKTGTSVRQPTNRDHFGFVDGISQPVIHSDPQHPMEVPFGDVLCGYSDGMLDPPDSHQGPDTLMFNGSFLAIRKISQDVKLFRDFDRQHEAQFGKHGLTSLMVGRRPDGTPLIADPKDDNSFDYSSDPSGETCPFAAHIRRANPRSNFHGRRDPQILRRGMSYGEAFDKSPDQDRGIIFMAYGASLSEQYETVQRWVNGANSTGVYSGQNDPIFGISPDGNPRTFRFIQGGKVERVALPAKPFTHLKWGTYLFVPSRTGIKKICDFAMQPPLPVRGEVARGDAIIQRLETLPTDVQSREWQAILSDFLTRDPTKHASSPAIWEAISARGGGYRLDAGIPLFPTETDRRRAQNFGCPMARINAENARPLVLITNEELISQVLSDSETFSVSEQSYRAEQSTGAMFVAQDSGPKYWAESKDTNQILFAYQQAQSFSDGYERAQIILKMIRNLTPQPTYKVELRRNFFSPVLGLLCQYWFSIPDGTHFELGDWGWDSSTSRKPDALPRCPGDFLAPSRSIFYPRPNGAIQSYGVQHGRSIHRAAKALVREARAAGGMPGTVSSLMFDAIEQNPDVIDKDDVLARNIIGIMVGALAPMDGNLRAMLFEWFETESFWRIQGRYLASDCGTSYDAALAHILPAMKHAMSVRPAPDLLYRLATTDIRLGNVDVKAGDMVVLSLVAATQARLARGEDADMTLVFGGHRTGAIQAAGKPVHACPAYKMAMGAMMGIMAALFEAGRIQILPASMIVEIDPRLAAKPSDV